MAVNDSNRVRGGDSYTYDITVTSLQNTFLPLPYPISQIDDLDGLGTDWSLDPSTGVAFSTDTAATGRSYRVAALDPRIQSGQLRDAAAAPGRLLASAQPARRHDAADQASWPGRSPRSPRRRTTRPSPCSAGSPGTGGFTYSTNVPSGADADYIAEFLERARRLLRAVRGRDGDHGALAGHPVPRRRRLHAGRAGRGRRLARDRARRACLARALVRGCRLGALRADAEIRRHRVHTRVRAGSRGRHPAGRGRHPRPARRRGVRPRRHRPHARAVPPAGPDRPARPARDGAAARSADGPPTGASPSSPARTSVRRRRRRRVGRGGRPGRRLRPAVVGVQHAAAGGGATVTRNGRAIGRGAAAAAPGG